MTLNAEILQCVINDASDNQIKRVVALLDAMPARGAADTLIAPLRPRLAAIRPPRPLTLSRLLFVPLDPLIVSSERWQSGTSFIPRSAIRPLASMVTEGMGTLAGDIAKQIAGQVADDNAAVDAGGSILWPTAARFLSDAPHPVDWVEQTTLTVGDYHVIREIVSVLLSQALRIRAAAAQEAGASEDSLHNLVVAAATRGPQPLGAMIALLLAKIPENRRIYGVVGRFCGSDAAAKERSTVERAIAALLNEAEAAIIRIKAMSNLSDAASSAIAKSITKLSALLGGLGEPESRQSAEQHRRIGTLRRLLDETCRTRFDNLLKGWFPDLLTATKDRAELVKLEAAARELRRFEQAGRQAGNGGSYDRLLRQAAQSLATMPQTSDTLSLIERARLVEILLDADAAMALFPVAGIE
jgi:hypothetical protein